MRGFFRAAFSDMTKTTNSSLLSDFFGNGRGPTGAAASFTADDTSFSTHSASTSSSPDDDDEDDDDDDDDEEEDDDDEDGDGDFDLERFFSSCFFDSTDFFSVAT
jgi:hypothetical protein